ncbi:UDP-3-O-(3-hydroxymyristoyl)glucosamine N-acyltransferase [Marinovum algicola]|jgi:UDP-3-O-[3-hydroxymyristoyl] glucosamine N-acyltransferase|uniref:UDP-3-O-(3-hydroxymyristoyl)glucosamine N-acyltransferase n=1 Tax=Marinovum TaxID=367771 RepID=UPI00065B1290|nr:UDP-3-O-(3-hydroxymyristoyl)glucosamine N-acyltransferase [Marinovum algicola]AKO96686.1 UDP-3-O-[3-hydroxymyristoyl] glucosamine N-acyltransferase [Marinovum algicola DG 898]
MTYTVQDIAAALGCEAAGATDISIEAVREPAEAGPEHLALAMKPEFAETLSQGRARAALLWTGADWQALGLEAAIFAQRPRFALSGLSQMMDPGARYPQGIHPTAVIDPSAEIGEGVTIGPLAMVGPNAVIGARSVIGPQCYIGAEVRLGEDALLHAQVTVAHGVTIGARFMAQSGARIGSDGFSFVTPEKSGAERARETLGDQGEAKAQSWARIHSLGGVTIGNDVEVGSNTCIDRGTVRDTVIGDGTKIDNLVQIGHNCIIGKDCLICGHVGFAGSVKTGNNCVFGGQTGIADNLFIGDNVISGGGTTILSNVPSGRVMLGYPATKMDVQTESYKAIRRLPRLMRDVAALKKAVSKQGESD